MNGVYTCVSILMLPLYIAVLICMYRNRVALKSTYYTLCISAGVSDILTIFFKLCVIRLPSYIYPNVKREWAVVSSYR